jgi:hypothetical protein
MFRHDARAMLYAPLRTLVWEDSSGSAWFTFDQPTTQFQSLGIAEVTEVGRSLDKKLVELLRTLELAVPEGLIPD